MSYRTLCDGCFVETDGAVTDEASGYGDCICNGCGENAECRGYFVGEALQSEPDIRISERWHAYTQDESFSRCFILYGDYQTVKNQCDRLGLTRPFSSGHYQYSTNTIELPQDGPSIITGRDGVPRVLA